MEDNLARRYKARHPEGPPTHHTWGLGGMARPDGGAQCEAWHSPGRPDGCPHQSTATRPERTVRLRGEVGQVPLPEDDIHVLGNSIRQNQQGINVLHHNVAELISVVNQTDRSRDPSKSTCLICAFWKPGSGACRASNVEKVRYTFLCRRTYRYPA